MAVDDSIDPSFVAWKARFGKEVLSRVVQGTLTSHAPKYTTILELDRTIRYVTDTSTAYVTTNFLGSKRLPLTSIRAWRFP